MIVDPGDGLGLVVLEGMQRAGRRRAAVGVEAQVAMPGRHGVDHRAVEMILDARIDPRPLALGGRQGDQPGEACNQVGKGPAHGIIALISSIRGCPRRCLVIRGLQSHSFYVIAQGHALQFKVNEA